MREMQIKLSNKKKLQKKEKITGSARRADRTRGDAVSVMCVTRLFANKVASL